MDIARAMLALRPDAEFSVSDSYESLEMLDGSDKPSLSQLEEAWSLFLLEDAWKNIREKRNNLLSACDWTQLPDSPVSDSQKKIWETYRLQLRNITQQKDAFSVVWPLSPNNQDREHVV